jgi:quercetin dioxygenase-like cupin family protein
LGGTGQSNPRFFTFELDFRSKTEVGVRQTMVLRYPTRVSQRARAEGPSKTNATTVTFVPGARSVWHKHDIHQVLVVTTGLGIRQMRGQPAEALRPGDVATVPPGIDHWHGASANSLFAHISLLESTPQGTDWGAAVTEDHYRRANTEIASA